MRALKALVTSSLLVGLAMVGAGCCEIQKQPGRCAACCYDNCVIPAVGTSSTALPSTPNVPGVRNGRARPMAY